MEPSPLLFSTLCFDMSLAKVIAVLYFASRFFVSPVSLQLLPGGGGGGGGLPFPAERHNGDGGSATLSGGEKSRAMTDKGGGTGRDGSGKGSLDGGGEHGHGLTGGGGDLLLGGGESLDDGHHSGRSGRKDGVIASARMEDLCAKAKSEGKDHTMCLSSPGPKCGAKGVVGIRFTAEEQKTMVDLQNSKRREVSINMIPFSSNATPLNCFSTASVHLGPNSWLRARIPT